MCAPPELVTAVKTAKQFLTYVSSGPFQYAIAVGLQLPDAYFDGVPATRCATSATGSARGSPTRASTCCRPQGTYFATVDIRSFGETDGLAFCRSLPHRCGVVAVPSVVFYDDVEPRARPLVRFACCKRHGGARRGLHAVEEPGQVIVAGIQHDIVWESPEENFVAPGADDRAAAAAAGARLVVLTEMFSTGFSMKTDRIAEPVGRAERAVPRRPGPVERRLGVRVGPRARRAGRASVQPAGAGRARRHDRTDTPRSIRSPTGASTSTTPPGANFLTVDVEGTRCSFFVCYDLRFADEFWALAGGTDCYVVPANWPAPRREHWMALLRARAIENQAYVVGVNRVGDGGRLHYCGDSTIVDPFGEIVAQAGDSETIIAADVDPERVRSVRAEYPFLQDRR